MATTTITALTAASGIDAINDYFPIDRVSLLTTQKINRNTFLGITGSPLGTTDTQVVTNKTLGITNTVTLLDTLFTLQDNSDNTKQAQFQLSGITTATTRTYTLPNASSTLADIATAQTFTNKTLTSPVITGGTITNTTISVDSIAEFTSANGVTVDGLNIKDGKLNTNNSVVTANITDAAATPAKLLAGTGSSWVWQNWTPTFTNVTLGNGTLTAKYSQTGKTVQVRFHLLFGNTTAVTGTGFIFTLPVTSVALPASAGIVSVGTARSFNGTSTLAEGFSILNSTTTAEIRILGTASTYANLTQITSTVPFTWGNAFEISTTFTYEAA